MTYKYSFLDKIKFYLNYFFLKTVMIWFDVKNHRVKMFLYEMSYSLEKIIGRYVIPVSKLNIDYIETKFGKFFIRPKTIDIFCASPAFERQDLDYLLDLMEVETKKGKKIIFFDIGGDIGTYSIAVGNRFRDLELDIVTFEPTPSSFEVLSKNVRENRLESKINLVNLGLSNAAGKEIQLVFNTKESPGSSTAFSTDVQDNHEKVTVRTDTLDNLFFDKIQKYDCVFIKADIEGMEPLALEGATRIINSGKRVIAVVEDDFTDTGIINYLNSIKATFLRKLTNYNSWWLLGKSGPVSERMIGE
jgi:FkbM family methyltransferase